MNDSLARVTRTVLQLVAAGGLYALTQQIADDVPDRYAPYVLLAYTLIVTVSQNLVEQWTGKGLLRPNSPPAPSSVPTVGKVS